MSASRLSAITSRVAAAISLRAPIPWDSVCDCGHPLWEHLDANHDECLHYDARRAPHPYCGCDGFRARKRF